MKSISSDSILTLATIRPAKRGQATQYLFNERQQIFSLKGSGKPLENSVGLLKNALAKKRPVKVVIDDRRGQIIQAVDPSDKEVADFRKGRILLQKPGRPQRVDVADIDPTRFNLVNDYLTAPAFFECTRAVPTYKKAKELFDLCARQSCNLPGPYTASPCIPFQYVKDGCYARAHKMRQLLTSHYRFCCEKVFCFANAGYNTLAAEATKWGGCCVLWWYHVAPLIRIKVPLSVYRNRNRIPRLKVELAHVIDPGIFNQPVLLSTWLAAVENLACHELAKVSMYSIQKGSAYIPADYQGTQYVTDPDYTLTDRTLNAYKNLTTCPLSGNPDV